MAIKYPPKIGTVLLCDFSGNKMPEMTKRRPVVVLSTVSSRLCTVVPFSTTPPNIVRPFHYKLVDFDFLSDPFNSVEQWVKADMIYTVSYDRLEIPFNGKDEEGKRKRIYKVLEESDLIEIRKAVLEGLCINVKQFVDTDEM